MKASIIFILNLLCWPTFSEARIFNMGQEKMATYLRGTYNTSTTLKNNAFANSSGADVTFASEAKEVSSFEAGIVYSASSLAFRFSLEYLRPETLSNAQGLGTGSAHWMTVESEASVISPKFGMDINLAKVGNQRFYLNTSYGFSNLYLRNAYTMTAAGQAQFAGVTDYTEELRATAPQLEASLGWEFLLADTTTLQIEGGYRQLKYTKLSHKQAITQSLATGGAVAVGDQALDNDGNARTLDLSGMFFSVGLRIWMF